MLSAQVCEMSTAWLNRNHAIIATPVTTGASSVLIRADLQPDNTVTAAALDFGYKALPAFWFYVIMESLIGQFELLQQRRLCGLPELEVSG